MKLRSSGAPRIDPKFVNNYELSDIQFRVEEGFTMLKLVSDNIIQVPLNAKFKFCEGSPPVLTNQRHQI